MTSDTVQAQTWRLLYAAIVGRSRRAPLRTPDTEGQGVTGVLRELEAHYGGIRAAARATGVPLSTWGFWRAGVRKPKPGRLEALRPFQRRARVAASREKWMRRTTSQIGLHLTLTVSRDTRERKIIITGWREVPLVRTMRDDILNAFFAMNGTRAVEIIEDALNGGIHHDTDIEEIFDIRWFKTRAEALSWQRTI